MIGSRHRLRGKRATGLVADQGVDRRLEQKWPAKMMVGLEAHHKRVRRMTRASRARSGKRLRRAPVPP